MVDMSEKVDFNIKHTAIYKPKWLIFIIAPNPQEANRIIKKETKTDNWNKVRGKFKNNVDVNNSLCIIGKAS